jgi:signal transduction histidine kinase/ActR/RegA family two-component response regulator
MALIVEASNPGLRCSILLVDLESSRITVGAGPSLPAEYNSAVEGLQIGPTVGSCGTAAFWNVPVVVENIAEDPLWSDLRQAAALAGVCACWSHPIVATNGTVLGAIALYADAPRAPSQSQMDGLESASHMVGLAIERDRLEEQLRQAAQLEAIGRLAGGIAHDFNNLLTVILGHVDQMRRHAPSAPEPQALDAISHAVARASQITSQLLAFGRQQIHRPEHVELGPAVLDVMHVLDPVIGDEISVSLVSDPSAGSIMIDRTQLAQIMLNLVLNARDAMPAGGQLDIQTRHATSAEVSQVNPEDSSLSFVAISVADKGKGMDSQTKTHAFEPFFSTKEGSQNSGLGLATVYGLVRQNGGYISVQSKVGQGTTFSLFFPTSAGAPTGLYRDDGEGRSFASVLVVEDNDGIRDLATRVLMSEGYEVTHARNGAEAMSLVEGGVVADLVVTDVRMPVMGGVELVQRLRAVLPDMHVLYISGHPSQSLNLTDPESPRARFLAKPFTPAQLLSEVRRALPPEEVDSGFAAAEVRR